MLSSGSCTGGAAADGATNTATRDRHTVLYIGVTNDLERRSNEHSLGVGSVFAREYNAHKLVYFETYPDPTSAIVREKQLKHWSRAKKEALIAPDSADELRAAELARSPRDDTAGIGNDPLAEVTPSGHGLDADAGDYLQD